MKRTLFLLVLVIALFGCAEQTVMTQEEAKELARERVMADYNYRTFDGQDLQLVSQEELSCEGCYRFTYAFDIDSDQAPSIVDSYEISVDVIDGDTKNFSLTEISGIDSYVECAEAGYEILEPDCEGCANQCVTPEGAVFTQKLPPKEPMEPEPICEDLCGDGRCQEIVCQAEGCPCPETKRSCPVDCD